MTYRIEVYAIGDDGTVDAASWSEFKSLVAAANCAEGLVATGKYASAVVQLVKVSS